MQCFEKKTRHLSQKDLKSASTAKLALFYFIYEHHSSATCICGRLSIRSYNDIFNSSASFPDKKYSHIHWIFVRKARNGENENLSKTSLPNNDSPKRVHSDA